MDPAANFISRRTPASAGHLIPRLKPRAANKKPGAIGRWRVPTELPLSVAVADMVDPACAGHRRQFKHRIGIGWPDGIRTNASNGLVG